MNIRIENFESIVKEADISALQAYVKGVNCSPDIANLKDAQIKLLVDQAFRGCLTKVIVNKELKWADKVKKCLKLIDFSFEAGKAEFGTRSMPATLLSEVFDVASIKESEAIFEYVEKQIPLWKTPEFFDLNRNILLRVCNDLLRRLSRTVNTEFCGRILVFLARCLPITEKSGLNLMSQFNTDNQTVYETAMNDDEAVKTEASTDEPMEEGEMPDVKQAQSVPVDYSLYTKFWQLQNFFSFPQKCFDKLEWRRFQKNSEEVLLLLANYKLEPPSRKKGDRERARSPVDEEKLSELKESLQKKRRLSRIEDDIFLVEEDSYFAKYLTSQKLLQLQLNDSQFRRYFLVQFLIIFQYLQADVKFKEYWFILQIFEKLLHLKNLKQAKTNDFNQIFNEFVSVFNKEYEIDQTNYEIGFIVKRTQRLGDDQNRWIEETSNKCYSLLEETYPNGADFAESIRFILKREEYWNDWKNAGCEDFTKRASVERMATFKRRQNKYSVDKIDLGNPELTRLWSLEPDNFKACRSAERKFMPDIETFLEEPFEQADPDNKIEAKYKLVNEEHFQWRAMRLLSQGTASFWSVYPTNSINLIFSTKEMPDCMEKVVKDVTNDIPKFKKLNQVKAKRREEERKRKLEEEVDVEKKLKEDVLNSDSKDDESYSPASNEDDTTPRPPAQLVNHHHVRELSTLLGKDWQKLAKAMDFNKESINAYKKNSSENVIIENMLAEWMEQQGLMATTKALSHVLLKAGLFDGNEGIGKILKKSHTPTITHQSGTAKAAEDKDQPEKDDPKETS